MQFKFDQVERALAAVYEIADDRRTAFSSRLKHLQRLGFPAGTNPGRGRVASYDPGQAFLLALALELAQLGHPPERSARLIVANLVDIAGSAFAAATQGPAEEVFANPVLLYVVPAGLSDLVTRRAKDREAKFFLHGDFERVQEDFAFEFRRGLLRMAFFSLSALLQKLATNLMADSDQPIGSFYEELAAWAHRTAAEDFDHV